MPHCMQMSRFRLRRPKRYQIPVEFLHLRGMMNIPSPKGLETKRSKVGRVSQKKINKAKTKSN